MYLGFRRLTHSGSTPDWMAVVCVTSPDIDLYIFVKSYSVGSELGEIKHKVVM